MRLAIYCDGNFVVTAPANVSFFKVEQFILEKARWVIDKLQYYKDHSGQVVVRGNRREYLANKGRALALVQSRLEYYSRFYDLSYQKINIKNQKTRWGSCSKKGNLNFNYRIIFLPERLADYIIVHELCHLQEFNHGPKFWQLVAKTFPDYRTLRREVKRK